MSVGGKRWQIVALVPMRHHSVRVPGKNLRALGGHPLYHHVVRALMACPSISQIVIDTDSDPIRQDVKETFPDVLVLERLEHLRGDDVPMTEVLVHDASQVMADYYVQTHSTNPFLRPETVEAAIRCLRETWPVHDSLFTVTRIQARLWDHASRPLNHNPLLLLQTQQLPPVYVENSSLYIYPRDLIVSSRRRIGDRPKLFELGPLESLDIDEERDFEFAELVMRARELTGKPA